MESSGIQARSAKALLHFGLALLLTGLAACDKNASERPDEAPATPQTTETQSPASAIDPELAQAGITAADLDGPYAPPADVFHPDKRAVKPALGGRIIMHISAEPPNLNFTTENTASIRWIHQDLHHALVEFNPSTWAYDPVLARSYDIEDTLILKGGRGDDNKNIVFGKVSEAGEDYIVTSGSSANAIEERHVPKADVQTLERGTVFTFHLRDDMLWHDGEKFDAEDVLFSWQVFKNPHVDCDEKRAGYDPLIHGEMLDRYTVRFFYKEQYFAALPSFGHDLCMLPSHLYNLLDPTNKQHNPKATLAEQGTYVNENPHNVDWVGLGPYKLKTWERGRYLEAVRFEGYHDKDPAKAGYADILRWTVVADDNLALQALLNGELDIFFRVKSEDFFGSATKEPVFTDNFYKAYTYVGSLGYTSWNLYRPQLEDVRVRTALAHAFDSAAWVRTNYKGLALRATGTMFRFGPGYNQAVKPLAYDVDKARALLTEAGWFDHDGDGVIDKDGKPFTLELLMPSGNKASEPLLQKMQESYEKLGIKSTIQPYEWATFLEKILDRDYDAANLAWVLPDVESDPFLLWHSSEAAKDRRTSNHAGLRDARVDELIERGRRELDPKRRSEIWYELHARIYELQPYLFGQTVPRKLAFNKKLRGVKLYKFDPGFQLRDMYYEEGTAGTRPLADGI